MPLRYADNREEACRQECESFGTVWRRNVYVRGAAMY